MRAPVQHRHASQQGSHAALADRDYPHGTRARYNGQKCRCFACRRANSTYEAQRKADPRIDATPVRKHLEWLRQRGIGLRAISDATDVPRVALQRWTLGQPTIRLSIAERILAADEQVVADGALVDATETRRLLRELIREGYAKTRIAELLGSDARRPALQYKAERVLAKTAHRVRKLHEMLTAEGEDLATPDDGPRERILSALRWFDSIQAQDLFDSMDIENDERGAYEQALHRLAKSGEVERTGDKPFLYAVIRANMEVG